MNGTVDLDRSAVARYLQLSSLFRRRIETGQWVVGERIPTVRVLTRTYGVAPATVRRALDSLAEEGLIVRYRSKGTFVSKLPVRSLWREIENTGDGFLLSRQGATIRLLDSRLVTTPPIHPHEGELAPSYRLLRRTYAREGRVFMMLDLYIDAALARRIPARDFTSRTSQDLMGRLRGLEITRSSQTLTIVTADVEASNVLGVELNAPLARIDRSRLDARGRLVTVSTSLYRHDVVRLDFRQQT